MRHFVLLEISSVLVLFVLFARETHSAKILSLNFLSPKSHKITYDPLLNELAKRGHEVTVVSQVPSNKNITNLREILTFDFNDILSNTPDMFKSKIKGEGILSPSEMMIILEQVCRETYALPKLQQVLNQKFDLVLHEPVYQNCIAGALYKLNISLILLTPISAPSDIVRILGGPSPPSFVPNFLLPYDNKMNFWERIQNFLVEVLGELMKQLFYIPVMEAIYREALNDPNIPGSEEIIRNASLALSFSHNILGGARPFMPDVIEVGGMHMREAKPLPKELEDFAQSSGEHGFIFFSMGSILQGSNLPEKQRNILLKAFSKLTQKVLWKWEKDTIPGLPPNVKLIKWAPQQDIFGHPKCRAFITHGGLGSTTESIYHGVPFIGLPMFGDQLTNMEKFVRLEVARRLEFNTFTEEDMVEAVRTLLGDPKYQRNVKTISKIYRDQRDDPLERAVFWVEYVLRHKGAVHLRSPARDLNFFQYHSLDVICLLTTIFALTILIVMKILRKLYKHCLPGMMSNNRDATNGKKLN